MTKQNKTLEYFQPYVAVVPSNIAFLKYWGKSDEALQWPANDSLSMTLSDLHTKTKAQVSEIPEHQVRLNDQEVFREDKVGQKIFKHLDYLAEQLQTREKLIIESSNSFPTGCGIASSASGLGALTLAAVAAWTASPSLEVLASKGFSMDRLIQWARIGSGSACRSLYGGVVHWHRGSCEKEQTVNQAFDESHWPLMDSVVLFSDAEKSVGSTEAHRSAWTSPLFAPRLASLNSRRDAMLQAIEDKNMKFLGPLIEQETLEMHGVIMSATPSVHYFGAETGKFLAWLRERRTALDLDVYFTLDAGPNVHLIYENHLHERVMQLLQETVDSSRILSDHMGAGPVLTVEEV
ncbi:diphosphomevalonate decarboxylase [Pseudobacteriovorax antillogorgiicola]|uniref:diphosphomevalonate decarboxylase n=1 Tax=Pseudobacteriovorax antillogorgiicola TaxID=1513793 RepID=A0A1Y6BJM4_9BACT|nr:diphosphomevalonate decarboxylase [Pseudobacteriovorax antillogorgiicola]TCS55293.1 diphosphomevalonate decarboxylase [Pseudobacteriovorax antillogorgiicola]SMF14595.1 diphosphomevalonate decarboxylase [Pseudobacteriovorax antillogorgiicola]